MSSWSDPNDTFYLSKKFTIFCYSVTDIKKITKSCTDCCKLKPKFHKPPVSNLMKATQPFECLIIDLDLYPVLQIMCTY